MLLYTSPLIPAEESIQIATAGTLSSSSYGLLGSYTVSADLYGVTLNTVISVHLEQFHTKGSDQHHQQNHVVPSELPAPL